MTRKGQRSKLADISTNSRQKAFICPHGVANCSKLRPLTPYQNRHISAINTGADQLIIVSTSKPKPYTVNSVETPFARGANSVPDGCDKEGRGRSWVIVLSRGEVRCQEARSVVGRGEVHHRRRGRSFAGWWRRLWGRISYLVKFRFVLESKG
ncbi:hypothetical protein L484_015748 [Morus notabilis]|uniref:Uncharacterized protein n=1 Tax=Morus notabilis TaxID=981085 RepID=W9SL59_9ROSA|nr:hypothetical protein L484_015748 [Morus notabilis]